MQQERVGCFFQVEQFLSPVPWGSRQMFVLPAGKRWLEARGA